jgi:hypothetical protein
METSSKLTNTPYIFFARSRDSSLRSEENAISEEVTTEFPCAIMRKNRSDARL